ncbi:MAG: GlsB/YeaQ/YmgE family stress response membrane protein [Gemmataceae bacterium]
MGIVSWILMGLLAGMVAQFILPGRVPGGWIWTIGLGLVGSLIGGFLSTQILGFGDVHGFDVRSIAIAVCGSVLAILAYDKLLKK